LAPEITIDPARTLPGIVSLPEDAERMLLGTIIALSFSGDSVDVRTAFDRWAFCSDDFGDDRHKRLITLIRQRSDRGLLCDTISLCTHIAALGHEEAKALGGYAYVSGLADMALPTASIQSQLDGLRDLRHRRELFGAMGEARGDFADLDQDLLDAASQLQRRAGDIVAQLDHDVVMAADLADSIADLATQQAQGKAPASYLRTGLHEWDDDRNFHGLSADGVTLFLGASGMGKTSVLNRLALGMARRGTRVYLHGTETGQARRTSDMVASIAGVDVKWWQTAAAMGRQDEAIRLAHTRMMDATEIIAGMDLAISGSGLDVDRVCALARMLHREGRCEVVFIDYLQNLPQIARRGLKLGHKTAQVDYASSQLAQLAAELRIPVVVGAQISNEKRGERFVPQLWDCQWSSGAHQDAEEVYALYRDDYYRDRHSASKGAYMPAGTEGAVDIHARKRRIGTLDTIAVPFHGPSKWLGSERWVTDRYNPARDHKRRQAGDYQRGS